MQERGISRAQTKESIEAGVDTEAAHRMSKTERGPRNLDLNTCTGGWS